MLSDIRYGLQLLARNKAFTAAALLTLALCIGANSAIFSVLNSVLLRPLPFPESDRVVLLYNSYPKAGAERASNGVPDYFDRLTGTSGFEEIALYQERGFTVGESGNPERITGVIATPSFFRLLRVPAFRGRWFTEEEGERGNDRKVVLSQGLWQERFGGRDNALGQTLRIAGEPYEIVGVMPRDFRFGSSDARLWTALSFTPEMKADPARHSNSYQMIGRLAPGVTATQAQAQIDALNRRNDERFPQFREILANAGFRTVVTGFRGDLVRDVQSTLLLLQGGVMLVLLIGCINIANLLLVRSIGRTRELATRAALGADRWRLVRQLLTESVVLGGMGGVLGLGIGWAAVRAFSTAAAELMPRGADVSMDWRVALITLLLSLIAGLLFGTIPVVRVLRTNLSSVFREEGRTSSASQGAIAVRGGLVVTQVSLAFALLIGTGLMVASFRNLLKVDTGFDRNNVLTASIALSPVRYANEDQRIAAQQLLLDRVRALPGVAAAGATDALPFTGHYSASVFSAEGYVPKPGESPYSPPNSSVSAGYFEAMGIDLVRGRLFDATDQPESQPVMIIDEWLANRFWPGQDPIGKQAFQGVRGVGMDDQIEVRTVAGIVKNIRLTGYDEYQADGHYYFPSTQEARGQFYVTIRTRGEPTALIGALRSAVLAFDPDLPADDIQTMPERMSDSLATDRLRLMLLIGFAGIALFLAGVGLYGVLAHTVAQRTSEMGIRMALGSNATDVFRLVIGHGLRLTIIGLGIGLAASLALSQLLRSILFEVQPTDPLVFAAVSGLLAVTAVLACAIPARRATRIDPLEALRR